MNRKDLNPQKPWQRGVERTMLMAIFYAALATTAASLSAGPLPALRIATFQSDITPPVGAPMAAGFLGPIKGIEAPVLAKGVVLAEGTNRFVLCALDWCRLQNESYDLFRDRLARAASTTPSRVAVHCLHQHDSFLADHTAERLLQQQPSPPMHLDAEFFDLAAARVENAVRAAANEARSFTHVGYGRGKVEKFASTRRVPTAEGGIRIRSSFTQNPSLHEAPEGVIDPWVRTVTFFDGPRPLARLHYYASHPQNNYGDGLVDPDVFEPVRARLEKEEGIPHIYFAGCGGDVTVGKYNVGTAAEVRAALTERLVQGIRAAIQATERASVSHLAWTIAEVRLPPRQDDAFQESALRARLADTSLESVDRIKAAWALAWRERVKTKPAVELSCLQLGPVRILHLPGEPLVEYQLYAQRLNLQAFVAVAGYGDAGMGYICTDGAFAEGGYEPTVSWVGPPTESLLKQAIARLLE